MAVRVPHILEETIERNPDYPFSIQDALHQLAEAIRSNAPMTLFEAPAPDYDLWDVAFTPDRGTSWLDAEWFFAEMLAYRKAMAAGRYWDTLRDPFAPFKLDEWASDALWETLDAALHHTGSLEERLAARLLFTLWGNRIDLSMKNVAAQGTDARDHHLLHNDVPRAVTHLLRHDPGDVHIVMDNAGTEQALDYALTDFLLENDIARTVTWHVKMHPVLVSDVIVSDVHRLFDFMAARGGAAVVLAHRLQKHLYDRRLRVVPDFFWNSAGRLWELPPRLFGVMQAARLAIMKGDVNYRRATNDALWPPDARLADAVDGFPAPVLLLRTLKSDTLIGIGADAFTRMDATAEADWRSNGTYGVAQFAE